MKAHIKERLLQIAKVKIRKTLERYPDMTGGYLTPVEVKLLLESGHVSRRGKSSDDWKIDYQLARIPIGDCTPTWVYFYNEKSELYMQKLKEHVSRIFRSSV